LKTESAINPLLLQLIESLRHELHQYGEMLALLEHQQESVMARAADAVLNSVVSINEQMGRIQSARQQRSSCQSEVARHLRQPEDPTFATLVPMLPEKFRVPVESLVRENNQLLTRVQQRARQNHLLLSRSLAMMQQLMNSLVPATPPTTYNGEGTLKTADKPVQVLYEAVG